MKSFKEFVRDSLSSIPPNELKNLDKAYDTGYDHAINGKKSKNPHHPDSLHHQAYKEGHKHGTTDLG